MSYDEQRMSDLIDGGLLQQEQQEFEKYCAEKGYTWIWGDIQEQIEKKRRGEYISHTAKVCLREFFNIQ